MNIFSPKYYYFIHPEKGIQVKIDEDLNRFNVDLLDIGDLKAPSKTIEVLSVSFDLEGFTIFTRQVDPHLTIPNFISDFFNWLFNNIKHAIRDHEQENTLWAELPFFSKFMGDGVLFLWKIDLDKIAQIDKHLSSEQLQKLLQEFLSNIITTMYDLGRGYKHFLKSVRTNYVEAPTKLRCGIARGSVFPIGNGLDFVGPCINISARLQKFSGLTFAFSARGVDLNVFHPTYTKVFIKKKVSIRGIGDNELIYIAREEFEKLPEELKGNFVDIE
jgi:class 3 adenylate cyclase